MKNGSFTGTTVAAKAFGLEGIQDPQLIQKKFQEAHFSKGGEGLKDLDLSMKGNTDDIMNDIVK